MYRKRDATTIDVNTNGRRTAGAGGWLGQRSIQNGFYVKRSFHVEWHEILKMIFINGFEKLVENFAHNLFDALKTQLRNDKDQIVVFKLIVSNVIEWVFN